MLADGGPGGYDVRRGRNGEVYMKKVVVVTLAVAALAAGVIAVWRYEVNRYNPSYHGKRLDAWAEQAECDEDPEARRRAAEVLTEALHDLKGQPQIYLVMRFCGQQQKPLPKEVIPFLLEALKGPEYTPTQGYALMALETRGGPDALAALERAYDDEGEDPGLRERAGVILSHRRKGWLDRRTRALLAGATKVEVFRLAGRDDHPKREGERRVGGHLVTAQGEDQGREFAEELAAVLRDEATYADRSTTWYSPEVAFRVRKGEEAFDVVVCFHCDNFYRGPPADQEEPNASFRGSPRRADFVRLAKKAFPDDQEIQALKE
jgi:hypothetical protein